jgi:hypothetical protein
MRRLSEIWRSAGEMFGDFSRSLFSWPSINGVRIWGKSLGLRFWPTQPQSTESHVNYRYTRELYRNEGQMALGSGFAKPIVDLQVAFMGLPTAATGNPTTDDFLNDCIMKYWVDEIQQMFRDAIRDSKVIVRMNLPDVIDPLMTLEESDHRMLEIIPPERVDIELNARNKNIIERAVVRHRMLIVKDEGDPTEGQDPLTEEHDVIEIITRDSYRFWDQTESVWMTELNSTNKWGFVPLLEVWNEFDASLGGGMSDLETTIPFIQAFHDVMTQGLQAHGYHSTPKIKLKLTEVDQFLKNNFPEVIDPGTGQINPNVEITWKGREIIFLQSDEDIGFIEARSVLGDTKTLLEFLIDCICISSQTPEWAFMRVDSGSANSDRNAQTVPFTKKVERKRNNFTKPIQQLLKMVLASRELIPVRAELSWEVIRADDAIVWMQAFQQLVMGLEAAKASGEISDDTYIQEISRFLKSMKPLPAEKAAAKRDNPPLPPVPAGLPPARTAPPVIGGPQGKNE